MESQIEIFVSCLTFMIHSNCTMRKFSYIHQGASKQNKDRLFFDSFVAKLWHFQLTFAVVSRIFFLLCHLQHDFIHSQFPISWRKLEDFMSLVQDADIIRLFSSTPLLVMYTQMLLLIKMLRTKCVWMGVQGKLENSDDILW